MYHQDQQTQERGVNNETLMTDGDLVLDRDVTLMKINASFLDMYFYVLMFLSLVLSTVIICIVVTLMVNGRSRSYRGCCMVALVSTFFVSMVSIVSRIEKMQERGDIVKGWGDCKIFPVLARVGSTAEILCVCLLSFRKGWTWKKRGRRITTIGISWKIASIWICAVVLEAPLAFFSGIQGVSLENMYRFKCYEDVNVEDVWILPTIYGIIYSVIRMTIPLLIVIGRCKHLAFELRLLKATRRMSAEQNRRNKRRVSAVKGEMLYLELFLALKAGLEIYGTILMIRTALFVKFREAIESSERLMLHMDFIRVALQPCLLIYLNMDLRTIFVNAACVLTLSEDYAQQDDPLTSRQRQRQPTLGVDRLSNVNRESGAERIGAIRLCSPPRCLKPKRCTRKYRGRSVSSGSSNRVRMESIIEESDSDQDTRSCPTLDTFQSVDNDRRSGPGIRYSSSQPQSGNHWNPFSETDADELDGRRGGRVFCPYHGALLQDYYAFHPWAQQAQSRPKDGFLGELRPKGDVSRRSCRGDASKEEEIALLGHNIHSIGCSRRIKQRPGELMLPPDGQMLMAKSQPELGGKVESTLSGEGRSGQEVPRRVARQNALGSSFSPPLEGEGETLPKLDNVALAIPQPLAEDVGESKEGSYELAQKGGTNSDEEKLLVRSDKGSGKISCKSISRSVSFPAFAKRNL